MTVVDYDLWGKFAYNYFNIHPLYMLELVWMV